MSTLQDTGNPPLLGGLLGSLAESETLALEPAEGPPLLDGFPCWAAVLLDLVVDLFGEDMGVEVRPPDASDILFTAHCIELRRELFDIFVGTSQTECKSRPSPI